MVNLMLWIILIAFTVLGACFGLLNGGTVTFHYLAGKADIPLSVLLLISLISGAILGLMGGWLQRFKIASELRRRGKELEKIQKELKSLRNYPLKESN